MATTFELISSVTVGAGGAASIAFSSIPSTFTDIAIELSIRADTSSGADLQVKFNSSGSSYSDKVLYGTGSAAGSAGGLGGGVNIYGGGTDNAARTSNTFSSVNAYIPNYAGSTNKSMSLEYAMENNATEAYMGLVAGLWSNTAAINNVTFTLGGGNNFVQYSTAYLYGVKNA